MSFKLKIKESKMKKLVAVLLISVLSLGTVGAFAGNNFVSYTQIQQSSFYHQSV